VIGVRDLIPVHVSVEAAVSAANATTGSQRNPSGRPADPEQAAHFVVGGGGGGGVLPDGFAGVAPGGGT
jgi:hypothetical protein